MKKLVLSIVLAGALVVPFAGVASAAKPVDPGCFGQDRADAIHTVFQNDGVLDTGPGASEWGHIAGDRAGDNGDMNRTYKTGCGGDPS
jgi:hypothetical protein